MRIRILGTLEVLAEGQWQPIGSAKWRSLLACLLLRAGQVVSTDALVDELWGEDPPDTARNLISIYALRVRRLLGDDRRLVFRAPGYVLNVADGDVDTHQFSALVADGRNALEDGDPVRAAALLSAALSLWRGPFLADVPLTALVGTEADRAEEQRLSATELWVKAHIACDRPAEVIGELRGLVADNPLREGAWLLLMRALDAAGRHAEALCAYGEAREAIADALGVDPGPELQQFYRELLDSDTVTAADMAAYSREPGPRAAGAPEQGEGIPVGDIPGRITMGSYVEAGPASAPAAALVAVEPSAASASDTPPPAQLPADIGDFTGRESQVGSLCDMLTGHGAAGGPGAVPIAFVAGAGGLGKTTLAIHAAHQIRDRFPDGQLYVDLLGATPQPLPPGDVLARFLRDLGVEGSKVPAGDEERAALYRTRLTGRRVLIVLDNARDNAQVRPLLPGSASCAVLVTTRNRTADLASTRYVDLHVLDDHEALELFTRILGDDRPVAEPDATAEVLVACAGLPLAIRICAARLAARRNWKIATMASRLRDERRRLDELAVGDLAVRASFQVSYDTLRRSRGVDPARAFRLLGLWQGASISLPGAAALVGAPEDDVADALESLVDANLLESSGSDRYRFHDLLRFYATERAQEEEPEESRAQAVRRLLEWYLRTADSAAEIVAPTRYRIDAGLPAPPKAPAGGSAPALASNEEALDWYDAERANLIAASRQAAQSGLHDVAWRLPTALFPVFNRRDNWSDCIASHRIALDSARLDGNRLAEGWASANLGQALARLRDKEALGHLEQALATRRELGDDRGAAQATLGLADAYLQVEGPEVALEHFQRSARVLGELGDPSLLGICLNNLGEVYLDLARLDEAMDCFTESLEVGSPIVQAHTLHNMGRVYLEKGHPQEAVARLRESVELHQSTGDVRGQAIAWKLLGQAYRDAGEPVAARDSWSRALALYRQVSEEAEAAAIEASIASLDKR
jgi:DNA-binding SARP family transcriptional activator/predicted negative regulator of RcsB-dependent stress response